MLCWFKGSCNKLLKLTSEWWTVHTCRARSWDPWDELQWDTRCAPRPPAPPPPAGEWSRAWEESQHTTALSCSHSGEHCSWRCRDTLQTETWDTMMNHSYKRCLCSTCWDCWEWDCLRHTPPPRCTSPRHWSDVHTAGSSPHPLSSRWLLVCSQHVKYVFIIIYNLTSVFLLPRSSVSQISPQWPECLRCSSRQ